MADSYNTQTLLSDLAKLQQGRVYSYASLSSKSQGECTLLHVDKENEEVWFRRPTDKKDQKISVDKLEKLASALSERGAVEINSLYGGSGNYRQALEALVARTSHIFLCEVESKKNIFWDPTKEHEIGSVVVAPAPENVLSKKAVKTALAELSELVNDFPPEDVDTLSGWLARIKRRFIEEIDLRPEFRNWSPKEKRTKDGKVAGPETLRKYVSYLNSILRPIAEDGKSATWDGLYCYLFGSEPKPYYQIVDAAEFASIYGFINKLFDDVPLEGVVDHERYLKVREWVKRDDVKGSKCLPMAFDAYEEFLKWREQHPQEAEFAASVDRLTAALKLFAERRKVKEPDGCLTECFVTNGKVRESFGSVTQEQLEGFTEKDLQDFFCGRVEYPGTGVAYENMWSGKNGQGWGNIKPSSGEELNKAKEYLVRIRQDASVAATFLLKGAEHPKGFGPGVVSELLMKFHPECCFKHGSVTRESLNFLGLANFTSMNSAYDEGEYKIACGAAAQILARMKAMKLPRAINIDGTEDSSSPDYLTVNEFIWFVSRNKDLIKEKVMSAKLKKPDSKCSDDGKKSIVDALKDNADSMLARLTASLLAKPFVILAGASGTGKSRMVKKLAYMTCRADMLRSDKDETPGNYCMIAVKPNWHDSSELLGYKSSFAGHEYVSSDFVKFILKAFAFPETPFFVCLDEMNLAPVEQYFAEYLSAVESAGKNSGGEWVGDPLIQRGEFGGNVMNLEPEFELTDTVKTAINEKGLYIPQNLFVVGTVNMDDTTNQFSRKVLDRAMTIMMNEVEFSTLKDGFYEKLTNELRIKNEEIQKFIDRVGFEGKLLDDDFVDLLNGVKDAVGNSPFEIGYRFAIETALYREAVKLLTGKKGDDKDLSQIAVDHLVLMKVLPRITGTLTERKMVLDRLAKFLGEQLGVHKLSADMLEKMKIAAANNGEYISFWP